MTATRVLCVGAGGIAAPFGVALTGVPGIEDLVRLGVADDDVIETSNLHRQILFEDADVGRPKTETFARALRARAPALEVETIDRRFVPDVALELTRAWDVVVDACDNFATRFLVADAARIVGRPVVHAAAVRWNATVLASPPDGRPCYRCLFEDLPSADAPDCATAGVLGPVCGVAGALAAALVLAIRDGDPSAFGRVHTYDGRRDRLRSVALAPRRECALCGPGRTITTIQPDRYVLGCAAEHSAAAL